VLEFSPSAYLTDTQLSRLKRIPLFSTLTFVHRPFILIREKPSSKEPTVLLKTLSLQCIRPVLDDVHS
jgi:hypothetical protein